MIVKQFRSVKHRGFYQEELPHIKLIAIQKKFSRALAEHVIKNKLSVNYEFVRIIKIEKNYSKKFSLEIICMILTV